MIQFKTKDVDRKRLNFEGWQDETISSTIFVGAKFLQIRHSWGFIKILLFIKDSFIYFH